MVSKEKEGDLRTLSLPDDELELKIEEAGFIEVLIFKILAQ